MSEHDPTETHPLLQATADILQLTDRAARKALNLALLEATGQGFRRGVSIAASQVKQEVSRARSMNTIACYDEAREMAQQAAELAALAGDIPSESALLKLAQRFGDLTAVIEKQQRKAFMV